MSGKNYAWPITAISKENYNVIVEWAQKYKNLIVQKTILIFGAGIRGAEIAVILRKNGVSNIVFTDNNREKWGGNIDGFPIISVDKAMENKERYLFLISVEEGSGICRQLEEHGLEHDVNYFYPKPNLYDKFIEEYKRRVDEDILVLGDCMFEVISFDDEIKDSLTEILRDFLGQKMKNLTMHGLSMPGFLHMIRGQINSGYIPKSIVLMINFETLTGKQHLLPRSQHTELVKAAYEFSPDPDGELKRYYETTLERVKNIQAEFFTTDKHSSLNMENNSMGKISDAASKVFFKLNYLYKLDVEMESIECLKTIMSLCNQHRIKFIPFVPPVNYSRGAELFGEDYFENRYQSNLEAIKKIIEEFGYKLLDLSHVCKKTEFAHVTTPDETTNYKGRLKIARLIVEELGKKGVIA